MKIEKLDINRDQIMQWLKDSQIKYLPIDNYDIKILNILNSPFNLSPEPNTEIKDLNISSVSMQRYVILEDDKEGDQGDPWIVVLRLHTTIELL